MKFTTGNILTSNTEAIVNTVNTVGVMGKGIALQFKEQFPLNYELYAAACKKGEVQTGRMFITSNGMIDPKWIINFPTKQHWMHKSKYEYITAGLDDLKQKIKELNIQSIAIPPLGAGQGGLEWSKVKEIIKEKLGNLETEIIVFEPVNEWSINRSETKSRLTKSRALILSLINRYRQLGFDVSLLEIQKLAYFLQRMGQHDLKLNYKEYLYGPYAHNLQHLLHELEKGYIITNKSILDYKPLDLVYFNPAINYEVNDFIEKECSDEEKSRLNSLMQLMSGFESPFGLELLSTIDWIINREKNMNFTADELKTKVREWSERKDSNFNLTHIQSAQERLSTFKKELYYL